MWGRDAVSSVVMFESHELGCTMLGMLRLVKLAVKFS